MKRATARFSAVRLAAVLLLLVTVVALVGCGKSGKLKTYPVTVRVSFSNGKPLAGGHVTFQSVDHPVSATGTIEADGTCRLGTYTPKDGAVSGRHRASIIPPRPPGDPDETPNKPLIHSRYFSPDTSGLEFTVKESGDNLFDVRVEPPKQ